MFVESNFYLFPVIIWQKRSGFESRNQSLHFNFFRRQAKKIKTRLATENVF